MNMHTRAADRGNTLFRSVSVRPNSFDPATGTFEAVIATETPVRRPGHLEILPCKPDNVELPQVLPLVLDHESSVRSRVGSFTPRFADGNTIAGTGKVSNDPSLDWLRSRLADGTQDSVSIAFTVGQWRDGRDAAGTRTRTAERWALRHASLVAEPADAMTGIRSFDDDDDLPVGNQHIRSLCRSLSLSREIEDRAIDEQWSDSEIRSAMSNRSRIDIRTSGHNAESMDNVEAYHRAASHSLVTRMTGEASQGASRQFAAMSWAEFHRQHLKRAGQSVTGLSDVEVITRALSTSDMPLIAGGAVNYVVRQTYNASASPLAALAGQRSVPDFRPQPENLVDWTTLKAEDVGELGEFKYSYVSEEGEVYFVGPIGGITRISRQLYVNGAKALGNLGTAQGRRLAAAVNDRRAAYLVQNAAAGPTMRDDAPVFSAAPGGRGNVLALNTISLDSVIDGVLAARAAMVRRQGAGDVMIGQLPTYWLVAPEFEGTAVRALAAITATTAGDVNPLAGKLSVVSEPRLTDENTSYLACAPANMDGLVQASLDGQPGPYTESRWGFEIDAVEFKIRLDLGFGWVEWRSWTRLDHGAVSQ